MLFKGRKTVGVPQKNLFRNVKEMYRAVCHIKRNKILLINISDSY